MSANKTAPAPVATLDASLVEACKSFAGFGRQKTLHAAWGAALRAGVDLGAPNPAEVAVAEASAAATEARILAKGEGLGRFDTADTALRRAQALRTLLWLRANVPGGAPNLGAMGAAVSAAGSKEAAVWADLLEAAQAPVVKAEPAKAGKAGKAGKAPKGTPIPEAPAPAPARPNIIEGLVATALARGMSAADIAALVAAVA